MDGLLVINKPAGMTSHDVVARVRRILNERSVGHLGTLDPSAAGVLPLLVGRFTRLAAFFNDADKRYDGVIIFGQATDSYDAQGEPRGPRQAVNCSLPQLREAAAGFVGLIQQMPPPFSAKKIGGVPAYKMARKHQPVELKPKQVEVKEFTILDFDGEGARFKAWVTSGTYIRSLAHDLGKRLGLGAHLGELTRTAVREFELGQAQSLEQLAQAASSLPKDFTSDKKYYCLMRGYGAERASDGSESLRETVAPGQGMVSIGNLLSMFVHPRLILPEFPAVTVPPDLLTKIRHGAAVNLPEFTRAPLVRVFADQVRLVAIAKRIAGTLFHPKVVLI